MSAHADTIGVLMTDTSPRSATSRPAPSDPAVAPADEPSSPAPGVPAIPQEALLEEPRRSRLPAAVRAMRPRQWVKNVLVFTAPLAAGKLFDRDVLVGSA
jgi:decaprenyl-phosphate phosphoribosyltransferase